MTLSQEAGFGCLGIRDGLLSEGQPGQHSGLRGGAGDSKVPSHTPRAVVCESTGFWKAEGPVPEG